jgi:hypothetical protein
MAAVVAHGLLALVIILAILAIFALGVVSLFRMTGRGIKRATKSEP